MIDYHIREFDGRLEIPRNEYDKILKRHGHSGTMDDRPILAENHLKLDVNGKKYVRVSGHVDSEEIVPSNMVAGS